MLFRSLEMYVIKTEKNEIIHKCIGELPENQKILIILHCFESVSYEEISEIMNLPMGTVKSRLHRARLALKEKLYKLGFSEATL